MIALPSSSVVATAAENHHFATRKRKEAVYLRDDASPREAWQGLRAYLLFYNEVRPHQALGYRTSAETYFATVAP